MAGAAHQSDFGLLYFPLTRSCGTNPGTHFSYFVRSSLRSTQGTFEDVNTCIVGLTPGSLSSKPAGTLTIPVASMNFVPVSRIYYRSYVDGVAAAALRKVTISAPERAGLG